MAPMWDDELKVIQQVLRLLSTLPMGQQMSAAGYIQQRLNQRYFDASQPMTMPYSIGAFGGADRPDTKPGRPGRPPNRPDHDLPGRPHPDQDLPGTERPLGPEQLPSEEEPARPKLRASSRE